MLTNLYFFSGVLIVLFIATDIIWTTLRVNGGGPLTARLANGVWELALKIHHRRRSHRWLNNVGFTIVIVTILTWGVVLWFGWTLIFLSGERAVVNAQTSLPAGTIERAYFVGYTLITLGLGDYRADGSFWRIATVLASANGFVFVTLIVTYILPVVSAVSAKRQFATYVQSLGKTPEDIVTRAWNGQDFGHLYQHCINLTPMILSMAQQRLSYPIIHCFHGYEARTGDSPNLALLSEALLLLEHGVSAESRPDPTALYPLRNAITVFLDTMGSRGIDLDAQSPQLPNIDEIRVHGISTVSDQSFQLAVEERQLERQRLAALIHWDGWAWDEVIDVIIPDTIQKMRFVK
ncbi:MAG: ion channel [Chloroflexota bacterium]